MALKTTPVSKCLDRRLTVAGFEVIDLLAVFLALAVLNFLFGSTSQKLLLVWTPPAVLALALRLGKRGKPDGYLLHWLRYQVRPGTFSAFLPPSSDAVPPRLSRGGSP